MPIVEVHLLEGYADAEKARLGKALTDATRLVVPAAPEAITVLLHELPATDYYRGGERRQPASALPDPVEVVRSYLQSMEARDLTAAQAHLAEGFTMHFPGAAPMTQLSELITWAKPRYESIAKTYDGFDTAAAETGAVVYCRGTLHGVWPDGSPFDGIRFIDRFELTGGKITRQDVWNDMGEVRA